MAESGKPGTIWARQRESGKRFPTKSLGRGRIKRRRRPTMRTLFPAGWDSDPFRRELEVEDANAGSLAGSNGGKWGQDGDFVQFSLAAGCEQ